MAENRPWVVLACERATRKHPNGRTGTMAGYDAHKRADQTPCTSCRDAMRDKQRAAYWNETPEQRARRRQGGRLASARQFAKDPQKARDRRDAFRLRNRDTMRMAKGDPCADCGISYPYYVMQFDHIGDDKAFNIGIVGPRASRERLLAEIAKCVVVCANCHAERSHQRLMEKLGRANEAI